MEIHFLDVGPAKYGDSILCRHNGQSILIDGGHPADWQEREGGRRSLPDQMEEVMKKKGPWEFDMLMVTHAHLDHTGCLPKLVKDGTITAKWALVADEKYGWGRHRSHDAPKDTAAPPAVRRLAAALREDMVPDLSDAAAVRDFMDAAQKQEDAYKEMLATLKKNGTKIVRYGRDSTTALLEAFKSWNATIIGPSKAHLVRCADAVAASTGDAVSRATNALKQDASGAMGAEALYISMMKSLPSDAVDSGNGSRSGAALNDMSIVFALGKAGSRVLLAGDMQYVDPEVTGLEEMMSTLREKTKASGPYALAKTCHHTSENAAGATLFDEWGEDVFLVHSGGERDDPKHPSPEVLTELKKRADEKPGLWLRNDRNHLISFYIKDNGEMRAEFETGDADDFSRNKKKDLVPAFPEPVPEPPPKTERFASGKDDVVEVVIKIPHVQTRVTVTVDVSPGQSSVGPLKNSGGGPGEMSLAELPATFSRPLPGRLLVATCRDRLAVNVGPEAAARAISMLRDAGATVLDNLQDPARGGGYISALNAVHEEIARSSYLGVVLLGGPDVVPHAVFDTLEPALRRQIEQLNLPPNMRDPDDFIVWSDHPYGDTPELDLPVSRVPDGHSATLLLRALTAVPATGSETFGLRNRFRPFADHVYRRSAGAAADCLSSSPFAPGQSDPRMAGSPVVYLMLHGSDADATVFSGEDEDEEFVPAFDLSCVPQAAQGSVVFSGCCWGALIADQTALRSRVGTSVSQRRVSESIPLSFLQRGAAAFIGCTGVHYSPEDAVPDCFGGPMHAAFWEAVREGLPPSLALFQARIRYLEHLPHGREELFDYAVEYKIYHQFTCLGLGW